VVLIHTKDNAAFKWKIASKQLNLQFITTLNWALLRIPQYAWAHVLQLFANYT